MTIATGCDAGCSTDCRTASLIAVARPCPGRTTSPLRVGLSMEATVNVSDQSGKTLAEAAPLNAPATDAAQTPATTDVYAAMDAKATEEFINQAFADGELKIAGTAVTQLLPPMNMFSPGYEHSIRKAFVIEKLKTFFERFANL
jgi:hypothetical protein